VTTLVAYESSWKYLQVAWGASSGFEDPEFDDSLWATGATPFGSSYDCNYVYTTAWASGTDMLLRRTITIPANTASLDFVFGIDDIVSTYLDGVLINATDSTGGPCATRTDHTFSIASPTAGTFVLAVRARDTAWQGFFEMEVTTLRGSTQIIKQAGKGYVSAPEGGATPKGDALNFTYNESWAKNIWAEVLS